MEYSQLDLIRVATYLSSKRYFAKFIGREVSNASSPKLFARDVAVIHIATGFGIATGVGAPRALPLNAGRMSPR